MKVLLFLLIMLFLLFTMISSTLRHATSPRASSILVSPRNADIKWRHTGMLPAWRPHAQRCYPSLLILGRGCDSLLVLNGFVFMFCWMMPHTLRTAPLGAWVLYRTAPCIVFPMGGWGWRTAVKSSSLGIPFTEQLQQIASVLRIRQHDLSHRGQEVVGRDLGSTEGANLSVRETIAKSIINIISKKSKTFANSEHAKNTQAFSCLP